MEGDLVSETTVRGLKSLILYHFAEEWEPIVQFNDNPVIFPPFIFSFYQVFGLQHSIEEDQYTPSPVFEGGEQDVHPQEPDEYVLPQSPIQTHNSPCVGILSIPNIPPLSLVKFSFFSQMNLQ